MRTCKLSVCIDVYNYERFLPEAIESVLAQDFSDFELLIVDDCSSDLSYEIARKYMAGDNRVVAVQNPSTLGMVRNRNACLRLARGEYVKILHADDFLCSDDALTRMVSTLDANPGMSLVSSKMQFVDSLSRSLHSWSYFEDCKPLTGTTLITRSLSERRNLVGSPSAAMFRRQKALRGFDESFFHSADWEMWLHLLEQGCFGYIDEALVAYRRHENQQTEKDKLTLSQYEDLIGILNRYLNSSSVRLSKNKKNYLMQRAIGEYTKHRIKLGLGNSKEFDNRQNPFLFLVSHQLFIQQRLFAKALSAFPGNKPTSRQLDRFTPGINVCGFFKGEYGLGESSRAFCKVISESNLPSVFINIQSRDHRNQDRTFDNYSCKNPHSINLMAFSFDYARRFYRDKGSRFFKHHYNIALWYWELEKFPPRWHYCFDYYDEIWTPTSFCQKSLADVSPIPVFRINYPIYQEEPRAPDREGFGFKPESCLFLFSFDFHSVIKRKNPDGVISAFRKAFSRGDDAVLILKSINSHQHQKLTQQLMQATKGLNVIWINEHFDSERMKQLFSTIDCYVSLHRSEGLGLGIAQAMNFGKPVIATGYSGSMDLTTSENTLLVRYKLAELESDYGVYEKGNFWAEPDIDHAAEQMLWFYKNRGEGRTLGEKGKADIRRTMNPAISLKQMRERFYEIDVRFKAM